MKPMKKYIRDFFQQECKNPQKLFFNKTSESACGRIRLFQMKRCEVKDLESFPFEVPRISILRVLDKQ